MEKLLSQDTKELLDNPGTRSIVLSFVEKLPKYIERLKLVVDSGNRESLKYIAHELRGSASSFGLWEISDSVSELELKVGNFSENYLRKQVQHLEFLVNNEISTIRAYFSKNEH